MVLIFSFVALSQAGSKNQQNQKNSESQIVLYYGEGCPHCKIVDDYIEENKIGEKVSFVRKEVYYDQENQEELVRRARECSVSDDSIGVPFLWDGKTCLIGDQDIINFFKDKAK